MNNAHTDIDAANTSEDLHEQEAGGGSKSEVVNTHEGGLASAEATEESDGWIEFRHGGGRWSFDAAQLAQWDEEEQEFHFHSYHGIAEPTVDSMIGFITELTA